MVLDNLVVKEISHDIERIEALKRKYSIGKYILSDQIPQGKSDKYFLRTSY